MDSNRIKPPVANLQVGISSGVLSLHSVHWWQSLEYALGRTYEHVHTIVTGPSLWTLVLHRPNSGPQLRRQFLSLDHAHADRIAPQEHGAILCVCKVVKLLLIL